jgi:organic hydroperoxide reductase OsmC/OhrA
VNIEKSCAASGHLAGAAKAPPHNDNGVLDVKLTTPKELGSNGVAGANPEPLFVAAYSACFLGALKP